MCITIWKIFPKIYAFILMFCGTEEDNALRWLISDVFSEWKEEMAICVFSREVLILKLGFRMGSNEF